MPTDQVMENEEFQKYWLTHANANAVFEWLREQKPHFGVWSGKSAEIETVLIERHEPLINLGLALYATDLSDETSLSLFRNNDRTIKKAALSGDISGSLRFWVERHEILDVRSWVERHGILDEILDSFDAELLKYLLSNESIPSDLLVSLYKREKPFDSLNDEQWFRAIVFTTSNPRISTPYDGPMEISSDIGYHKVFISGWELFEKLPVNGNSAAVLSHLGRCLLPYKPYEMNVCEIIKRWSGENDEDDRYFKCRNALARLIKYGAEFESLKDSDDLALRESYYYRFHARTPEEVRKLFEKDKDKFLDVAIYNTKLYMNEEIREELEKCCWDYEHPYHKLIYPDYFKAQVEKLTKKHPEWFPDFEDDIPFHAIEDPILRVNKRLEYLQQHTKILSQKLIGSESEDQLGLINDVKIAIDDMKITISESNQLLSQLLSKGLITMGAGLLVIGLLIGFILAKWL